MTSGIAKAVCIMFLVYSVFVPGAAFTMGTSPDLPADISIRNQEAVISPMLIGVASVFMDIENAGKGDDELIGGRTDIPGTSVELHDVKKDRMVQIRSIEIPHKSTVQLKPKSLHIMIFSIQKGAEKGHELTLFLKFRKSGEKKVGLRLFEAGMADTGHSGHAH